MWVRLQSYVIRKRISAGSQMIYEGMPLPRSASITQGGQINRPDNRFFNRAGVSLGQYAAIKVNDHAASGP